MRRYTRFYGPVLLLFLAAMAQAQGRTDRRTGPTVASTTPVVRVTTENPREILLGKPATFVIRVANQGKTPATGVIVAASIPEHVELSNHDPQPIKVEGRVYKFRVGDIAPGATRNVTIVAIPRSPRPVKLDTTVIFATSTRTSIVVRRPILGVAAKAPAQVVIGDRVEWVVRVTNSGDGAAENVVLTPKITEGKVEGTSIQNRVQVGSLKAGETKEYLFAVIGSTKGKVTATFETENSQGLKASTVSTFIVRKAELALAVKGPQVQPLGRKGVYEIRVSNPGDTATGSTMVSAKIPAGLKIASAANNSYYKETRTLRWRITSVRPSDQVPLRFEAETVADGDQTISVVAQTERVTPATIEHTTNVISRPNLIVTVANGQELSAVGDQIAFNIVVVNAGSKPADNLRVRVTVPDDVDPVAANNYRVNANLIEFPAQRLASGEKVTLKFRAIGRTVGDHRIRVNVDSTMLTSGLAFEASAFCYSDSQGNAELAAQSKSQRRASAPEGTQTR